MGNNESKSSIGEEDCPSLYRAANRLSIRKQRVYFWALFFQLLLMALIVALPTIFSGQAYLKTIQLCAIIALLVLSWFVFSNNSMKHWYSSRAIAESVKTLTWRYIMKADPFEDNDDASKELFCERLKDIIDQNEDLSQKMYPEKARAQITEKMNAIRHTTVSERAEFYVAYRIENQYNWYRKKARRKGRQYLLYSGFYLAVIVGVLLYAVSQPANSNSSFWFLDLAVVIATGILTWIQAQKFAELRASYTQTAFEISLINDSMPKKLSDGTFAIFVKEAENAFSREHTQWIARKDY